MSPRRRMPAEQRKKEIREVAKGIFLSKGFRETTMQDVVTKTGMSKGGVYRHYGSTAEMLVDLMKDGNLERYGRIDDFLSQRGEGSQQEIAIEIILQKMLDCSEYKSLYAMLLMESRKNPMLRELSEKLIEDSKNEIRSFLHLRHLEELECLLQDEWVAFINAMIVATEVLEVRETFLNHAEMFRGWIRQSIEQAAEAKGKGKDFSTTSGEESEG